MGKLGDIGMILGLGIAGFVTYMFATGKWKLPDLGALIKLPEITMPSITLPSIIFPDQPKGATLTEAALAEALGSTADPTLIRMRELTGLSYSAPPLAWKKTPEELGLVTPPEKLPPITSGVLPSPQMIREGVEGLMLQGVTQEKAEWIYAGGIRGVGREQVQPLVPYAMAQPYFPYSPPGIVTKEAEIPAAIRRERGLPAGITVM